MNAQKTRLFNVSTRVPLEGGSFGSYVQVDDDESFLLDGLDTGPGRTYGVRCDAAVCNPVIYAPGPFRTFPGVGWLKNLNISLQCGGNGIDWQAGNTLANFRQRNSGLCAIRRSGRRAARRIRRL